MYPRLSDIFSDLFGIDLPLPLYSFGFMVATAIVTGTWLAKQEFDRMHAAGQLPAVLLKDRDAKGRTRMVKAPPSALVWTMMVMAAGFGIAGSKLFHIIDYWDRFISDPLGLIFNPAGLTFYGGLICAGLAIAYYARRKGLSIPRTADAIAPGLLLAYGIGRIGCYLAGDGDWGICSDLADKPAWIPGFLWSETFPRNVIGPDMQPVDVIAYTQARAQELGFGADVCVGADGVYPTMLYEFALAALLAGALWLLRRHPFKAGWLFSLYLIFAAVERFCIEFIRLNPDVVGGFSQSQVISIGLFIAGLIGLALTTRRTTPTTRPPADLEPVVA